MESRQSQTKQSRNPQDETAYERVLRMKICTTSWKQIQSSTRKANGTPMAHLNLNQPQEKSPKLFMSVSIPCFKTDILSMDVTNFASETPKGPACLLFRNNLAPSFDDSVSSCASLASGTQTLYFPLTNMPQWTLGGTCREYQFSFRANHIWW